MSNAITLSRNLKDLFDRARKDLIEDASEFDELFSKQLDDVEKKLIKKSQIQSCIRCENATFAIYGLNELDSENFQLNIKLMGCSKFQRLESDENNFGLIIPEFYLCAAENNEVAEDQGGSGSEFKLSQLSQLDSTAQQRERPAPNRQNERGV